LCYIQNTFLGTLAHLIALLPAGAFDAHAIVALAPFLDTETLEALIRGQR
jgi:hypothetical protein